jgi:hypothetical protein
LKKAAYAEEEEGEKHDDDEEEDKNKLGLRKSTDHTHTAVLSTLAAPSMSVKKFSVSNRPKGSEYGLKDEEISDALKAELSAWYDFMTKKFYGQREKEVRRSSLA